MVARTELFPVVLAWRDCLSGTAKAPTVVGAFAMLCAIMDSNHEPAD